MTEFTTALFGSFAGAFAGFLASWTLARQTDRRAVTDQLVAEFMSAGFLSHRIAVSKLRRSVQSGEVDINAIAAGFWFPGRSNHYTGEFYGELNIHQHLTAYIGYLVRLAHAHRSGRLDRNSARAALGTYLLWNDTFIKQISEAVIHQAQESGAIVPPWTNDARHLHINLVVPATSPRSRERRPE